MGTPEGARAATHYTTKPHGNFTLDIGEQKHEVLPHLGLGAIRWDASAPTELLITGQCTLGAYPRDALVVPLTSDQGETAAFPAAQTQHADAFTVRVPVPALSAGVWGGELRVGEWSVPLPALPQKLIPAKWRRRGLPWYAKALPSSGRPGSGDERFALQVSKTDLVKAVVGRPATSALSWGTHQVKSGAPYKDLTFP
ncbi:hypothetical protein B1C81_12690 [Streptomyces sp. HG99]|nr:hypothetical protein B1C81_12690 [Streptomyces sp. HG99]